jgi:hypothetical protein
MSEAPAWSRRLAARAWLIRRLYVQMLDDVVDSPVDVPGPVDVDVYAFSSETHVPEQVASLRSLLRHLGAPARIVVVSDGSHTERSLSLLGRVHPTVTVAHHRDVVRGDLPPAVMRYAGHSPMGVKLALELSFPLDRPTLYADADVLFFPRVAELPQEMAAARGPRYLRDFDRFLDERLLAEPAEGRDPVNAGFQALVAPLAWDSALERLERLERTADEPTFLSEQTLVHLAMHASGAQPLPGDRYVLAVDDEHDWRDGHGGPGIALRHYCYSLEVRQKLWLNVWDDVRAAARAHRAGAAAAGLRAVRGWWTARRAG